MPTIHILPDRVIGQIAAGEVVERPASVVKELLENALDAGARSIEMELEAGGKRLIRVADDGCGMDRDDALLAFDRHATSKIAGFEDLEQVSTLGFRGEALASIAAVSRVELTSAQSPGEGTRVRIEGGRVVAAEPASRPRGTTVVVSSLFFNVPARRKFLKRPQTELRRILEVTQGYALAHPEVALRLHHDGRELLVLEELHGDGAGLRDRIERLFGRRLAGELVEIRPPDAAAGEIGGFVGTPETSRGRRLFVFVNRRLLRDRAVLGTFYRAVRDEWKSEEFPALFLFLDLPADEVDVNVHPQKSEVRFRDPALLDRVGAGLRQALQRARGEAAAPLRTPGAWPGAPLAWRGLGEAASRGGAWTAGTEVREGDVAAPAGKIADPAYAPLARAPVPLSGRSGEVRPFRLLGQYKGTLILLEGPDGLYLVDQHVAHERILYERLRRALAEEQPASQRLLTPPLLQLSPAEGQRLAELAPDLERCGFEINELSGGTLALTAVPATLDAARAEKLLLALVAEEAEETADLKRRLLDALAASLACRTAVKMHHPLSAEEMERLVAELFAAEQPYACPHGRPIVLQMSDSDLERRFGRS